MTKDEALQMCLEYIETDKHERKYVRHAIKAALEQAEPVASPYNPNPVEYQYHYPDGSWRCSNGDAINKMRPDRARSLYALKDNT
jgi:hypothetical protein